MFKSENVRISRGKFGIFTAFVFNEFYGNYDTMEEALRDTEEFI